MRDKKNAPEIRFKGFWEPWEENTFNNLAEYKKGPFGSSLTKSIFVPKSTNAMKVYEQQNAICKNWKLERYFITKSYANKMSSFEVRGGDIIVSCAGTIGATYILPDDAVTGIINQALMRIRVNDVIIDKKLFIYLFTNMIDDFSKIHSNGSAIKNIPPFSDLKPTKVLIPNIKEQSKLIVFLSKIDDLIKFQQQKIDKLQNIKKSMLDKMFPKNGNTIPEIKFKGFSEPWEDFNLNSLVTFYSGLTYSPQNVAQEGTLVLRSSNVKNDEIIDADNIYVQNTIVNCENVKKGDIIVVVRNGSRALIGKHAQIKKDMPNTVIGAFMTGVRYSQSEFLNALLSTVHFSKEIEKNLGATINQITTGAFKEMSFLFPKNNNEQQKIGKFFSKIDDLIKFQQQKLEKLKNIKKSMLDKMFV